MKYFLQPDWPVIEQLKSFPLRCTTLKDITKRDTASLAVFVDFAGEAVQCRYLTCAYYITDWNASFHLAGAIETVKRVHSLVGRTFSYKGRKDRLKLRALGDWFLAVRRHPGLMLVVCFDKAFYQLAQVTRQAAELGAALSDTDLHVDSDTALRIVRAVSCLPIICHLLEPHHKLLWASDMDAMFDTDGRTSAVGASLLGMSKEILGIELSRIGMITPFRLVKSADARLRQHLEDLLSIPDMLAGSVAAALTPGPCFRSVDDQTTHILAQFARFADPYDVATFIRPAHLAAFSFDLGHAGPTLHLSRLGFSPSVH